jgi:hypothetical protein
MLTVLHGLNKPGRAGLLLQTIVTTAGLRSKDKTKHLTLRTQASAPYKNRDPSTLQLAGWLFREWQSAKAVR